MWVPRVLYILYKQADTEIIVFCSTGNLSEFKAPQIVQSKKIIELSIQLKLVLFFEVKVN